jgi:TPR repeat protein
VVAQDIKTGRLLLQQAAEKGDNDSKVRLAQMSAKGIGEERGKPNSVFQRYKQAADGDSRIGMSKCAESLIAGIGCGSDIAAATV